MIYPHLDKLIRAYRELKCEDRVGFVRVITNGTVVPSDEFCKAFREIANGYVTVSDYGSLSTCKDEVI